MTTTTTRTALATAIRTRRTELGMRQDDLAAKAGVATNTVTRVEAGEPVRSLTIARIEKALGWEPGQATLMLHDVEPPTDEPPAGGHIYLALARPPALRPEDIERAVSLAAAAAQAVLDTWPATATRH